MELNSCLLYFSMLLEHVDALHSSSMLERKSYLDQAVPNHFVHLSVRSHSFFSPPGSFRSQLKVASHNVVALFKGSGEPCVCLQLMAERAGHFCLFLLRFSYEQVGPLHWSRLSHDGSAEASRAPNKIKCKSKASPPLQSLRSQPKAVSSPNIKTLFVPKNRKGTK